MSMQRKYGGPKRIARIVWTLLTIVSALPFLLIAGLIGMLVGFFLALTTPRRFGYRFRSVVLQATLIVLSPWLRTSTRVYNALLGGQLYERFPLPRPMRDFYIVGHRGSPHKCCENTLHSYQTALREGANAVEIDLCLTKDGQVVIWHDWDPDALVALFRESGQEALQRYRPEYGDPPYRRPVPELTLAELRAHCGFALREGGTPDSPALLQIPTYREFLQWAARQRRLKRVFLDMKIPPDGLRFVEPMLRSMVTDYQEISPRCEVIFMTIYPEVLKEMKAHFPNQIYCFDKEITNTFTTLTDAQVAAHSPLLDAKRLGHQIGSVGRPTFMMLGPWEIYQGVVRHDLELRHQENLDAELISWTINDPEEQQWLIDEGVDGILTDLPRQLARKVLTRKIIQTAKTPLKLLRRQKGVARPSTL